MKSRLFALDAYFLVCLVEGLASLWALTAVPGDPKNGILFGLSVQRLLLAGLLLAGALVFAGLLITHVLKRAGFEAAVEKSLTGKSYQIVNILLALLTGAGLVGAVWLPETGVLSSAVSERSAPLLAWSGLVGGQGFLCLAWLRRGEPERESLSAGFWLRLCFYLFVVLPFFGWLLIDPAGAGLFVRSNLTWLGLSVLLFFMDIFNRRGRAWEWIAFGLTIALFLLPLIGIWASGVSDPNFLMGLFPYNDAHGYYLGARLFDEGSPLNSFAAHRPLFPVFLAFLLGISAQNLQAALALLVLLSAAAAFLFSREIRRTHGLAAGAAALLLIFLFYRRFTGSVMTENQGFAMGAAGFAVLWRAVSERKQVWFYIGLACLSVALIARAGPFFILPALGLWAAWFFRGKKWISWRVLAASALIASVGFAANWLMLKISNSDSGVPFSNFSYTLYGTVTGGTGWKQVFIDHPEVKDLAEPAFSQRIYSLAWGEFQRNPLGLVIGALEAWKTMFSLDYYGMFGFVSGENAVVTTVVRLLLFLLTALGLVAAARRWNAASNSFVLTAVLGVWFSVPFVPPLDAEIRTYAAVIPLFALLVCLGLTEFIQLVRAWSAKPAVKTAEKTDRENDSAISGWVGAGFALAFSIAAIVGPLAVRGAARPSALSALSCPAGEELVYARIDPGSYVEVVDNSTQPQTWLPRINWTDFSKSIHDFPVIQITNELASVTPPATIAFTHDLRDGRHIWLVVDSRLLPQPVGTFAICGAWTANLETDGFGFFYGSGIQAVSVEKGKDD